MISALYVAPHLILPQIQWRRWHSLLKRLSCLLRAEVATHGSRIWFWTVLSPRVWACAWAQGHMSDLLYSQHGSPFYTWRLGRPLSLPACRTSELTTLKRAVLDPVGIWDGKTSVSLSVEVNLALLYPTSVPRGASCWPTLGAACIRGAG